MLTLEGDDVGELDKAMQHVSYLNSRQFPTPGIRRLKITSTVKYVLIGGSDPWHKVCVPLDWLSPLRESDSSLVCKA